MTMYTQLKASDLIETLNLVTFGRKRLNESVDWIIHKRKAFLTLVLKYNAMKESMKTSEQIQTLSAPEVLPLLCLMFTDHLKQSNLAAPI